MSQSIQIPAGRFLSTLLLFVVTSLSVATVSAATIGDDGLHKQDWFALTFKDVGEDIAEAAAENKRVAILFEQAGCIYCQRMHETVLSDPEVTEYLKEHFVVVQYNLYGDEEVTDLDGNTMSEKAAAEKWGVMFTPTWLFMPETADGSVSAADAAVGQMPGAFGKGTFLDLFTWIYEKGNEGDESFQRFHARRIEERKQQAGGKPILAD